VNLGRIALLIAACVTSGGLVAGYSLEASSGDDSVMPQPFAMILWLFAVVAWQGFMAAHACATIVDHLDARMVQMLTAIRGLDEEDSRKTIDNHLAALHAVGGSTPTQRRPRPHAVRLHDR
jgi:hypothetical protein